MESIQVPTSTVGVPEGLKLARVEREDPDREADRHRAGDTRRRVCAGADLVRGVATGHGGAAPSTRSSVRHGVARGTHCSRRFDRTRARTSRRAKSTRRVRVPAALTARVSIFFSSLTRVIKKVWCAR